MAKPLPKWAAQIMEELPMNRYEIIENMKWKTGRKMAWTTCYDHLARLKRIGWVETWTLPRNSTGRRVVYWVLTPMGVDILKQHNRIPNPNNPNLKLPLEPGLCTRW